MSCQDNYMPACLAYPVRAYELFVTKVFKPHLFISPKKTTFKRFFGKCFLFPEYRKILCISNIGLSRQNCSCLFCTQVYSERYTIQSGETGQFYYNCSGIGSKNLIQMPETPKLFRKKSKVRTWFNKIARELVAGNYLPESELSASSLKYIVNLKS